MMTAAMARNIQENLARGTIDNIARHRASQMNDDDIHCVINALVRLLAHPHNGALCADFDALVEYVRSTM